MKKLLLLFIALFFMGCSDEPLFWDAHKDKLVECDDCDVCTDGFTGHIPNSDKDCNGECFGTAVEDCTGVCGGDTATDCAGECGGSAQNDECGVCEGDGIADGACDCDGNVLDCADECGGGAVLDSCNVCGGDGSSCDGR